MAQIYRVGKDIFDASTNQKIANPTVLANQYSGATEVKAPVVPQGATKISGPSGLQGLNESQIFRQGQDIYRLPSINTTLDAEQVSPDVPEPEAVNDVSSYTAGLDTTIKGLEENIKKINEPLPQEQEISEIRKRQGELSEQKAQVQETALPKAEEFGYTKYTKELQALMPQIASLKAQYDNAEIAQEGRKGLAGSIYGRQALIQRQRAVELAGLSAIAQAYQGNIQLATQTAQNMVEMELAPIQTRIDDQKWQIEQVYEQLTSAEQKKADSLNLVLQERQRLLDEEKDGMNKINEVLLSAAQGGASQAILDRVRKATTYGEAVSIAKDYLREKTSDDVIGVNPVDLEFTDLNELPQNVVEGTPGWANVLISQASKDYGVPASLISAIIKQESGFNPDAQNVNDKERSYGLGQINLNAHPQITEKQAKDPSFAVNFVAKRLKSMIDKYGIYEGIQAYNTPGAIGSEQLIRYANNVLSMAGIDTTASVTDNIINQSAQNWADLIAKGQADITNVPADERTAVVDALSKTVTVADTTNDVIAKEKAQLATDLVNHKGLDSAVGVVATGRIPAIWNIGKKQDFIASVEQLVSGLSLDSLVEAKSRGATFGALSDTEMRILASAATKIGTWRKLDKNGNVTGYKASESAFKNELKNINKILLRGVKSNIESGGSDPLDLGIANSTNPLGL